MRDEFYYKLRGLIAREHAQQVEAFRRRILDLMDKRVGGMETIPRAIMDDIRIAISLLPAIEDDSND